MVVMLIMSIILAAMAPVMTTRNKSDYSSPWRYSTNGSDAYFGAGEQQVALIGQHDTTGDDADTKLLINVADNSTFSHILFKQGASILGRLSFDKRNNLYLSNTRPSAQETSVRNTSIGIDALRNINAGNDNTAIGFNSLTSNTDGTSNVAIGSGSMQSNTSGYHNTAIGRNALSDMTNSSHNNIAIGSHSNWRLPGEANSSGWTPRGTIAIGSFSSAQSEKSIAIGTGTYSSEAVNATTAFGTNSIALGAAAHAGSISDGSITGSNSTAIGFSSQAAGDSSIALGRATLASNQFSVAIGDESEAHGDYSLAIGPYLAKAYGENSIAIGREAFAGAEDDGTHTINNAIAIGAVAKASSEGAISLGNGATSDKLSSIAIGVNASAVGEDVSYPISIKQGAIAIGNSARAKYLHSIAIGNNAFAETDGQSLAIGYDTRSFAAGAAVIGTQARAIGEDSISIGIGSQTEGDRSVAIGYQPTAVGNSSIAIGTNVTLNANEGNVVAIGTESCGDVTGANSVCIGYRAGTGVYSATTPNSVFIGAPNAGSDDNVYIGNSLITSFRSDRRLKYIGSENTKGLDIIRQLKVFNFTFKQDERKRSHVGIIAQDLQKLYPEAVENDLAGFLAIRKEYILFTMLNAIKDLDARMINIINQLTNFQTLLKQVQQDNIQLKKENQELKSRLDKLEAKIK